MKIPQVQPRVAQVRSRTTSAWRTGPESRHACEWVARKLLAAPDLLPRQLLLASILRGQKKQNPYLTVPRVRTAAGLPQLERPGSEACHACKWPGTLLDIAYSLISFISLALRSELTFLTVTSHAGLVHELQARVLSWDVIIGKLLMKGQGTLGSRGSGLVLKLYT